MKSAEIRRAFLEYFQRQQHTVVPSSSLIPGNDPTLLFTNAGMVQFKDTFLGRELRPYTRAVSVQRCVRAGGKHNDLENVGYTARHHTFFEMLGNFSFGDYFKSEAILYAWEFLVDVLNLPKEKLWITVFEEDKEAENIWLNEIKIDPQRFSRCGEKDNFWAMGETGPCGPCTEIFYDHGPEIPGGPPGSGDEGDRYIEIWNLVFMQYNRSADGRIELLPKPSVDTGMGLERISAVMQGVHNNYDIDIFRNLINAVASLAGIAYSSHASLKIIADHIRSSAFLIADGVTPSNEGRGYVLRRIIRRALRHGHTIGLREAFFYKLVAPLIVEMGEAYPELTRARSLIEKVLQREEELFATTLEQGLKILEHKILSLKEKIIPGDIVFKLYDTYGFPIDLTADIAREHGLVIDEESFHKEMAKQRERSLAASQFAVDYTKGIQISETSTFTGYEHLEETSEILAITDKQGQPLEQLCNDDSGIIILSQTPFYPEGGGQVGDRGLLLNNQSCFEVQDTQKQGQTILHVGRLTKGSLRIGDKITAQVDIKKRLATAYNHSATHLLNAALRELLGEHVLQKGSLVEPERLRFDFSHFEPLQAKQLKAIEHLVNQKIRENLPVTVKYMTPEEAMDSGAMALFGEKYGAEVRVLSMGDFSLELCGGTHVGRTGDIGIFKIISETGIASGIRRIEAITGKYALEWINKREEQINEMAVLLKTNQEQIAEKLRQLLHQQRQLEKEIEQLKAKFAVGVGEDLSQAAKEINGISILVKKLDHADSKLLRELVDKLKQKLPRAIIVLACIEEGKVRVVGGVTKNLTDQFSAGELINYISVYLDGKGGGRPDMAQGGGTKIEAINEALELVFEWVKQRQNI